MHKYAGAVRRSLEQHPSDARQAVGVAQVESGEGMFIHPNSTL